MGFRMEDARAPFLPVKGSGPFGACFSRLVVLCSIPQCTFFCFIGYQSVELNSFSSIYTVGDARAKRSYAVLP